MLKFHVSFPWCRCSFNFCQNYTMGSVSKSGFVSQFIHFRLEREGSEYMAFLDVRTAHHTYIITSKSTPKLFGIHAVGFGSGPARG